MEGRESHAAHRQGEGDLILADLWARDRPEAADLGRVAVCQVAHAISDGVGEVHAPLLQGALLLALGRRARHAREGAVRRAVQWEEDEILLEADPLPHHVGKELQLPFPGLVASWRPGVDARLISTFHGCSVMHLACPADQPERKMRTAKSGRTPGLTSCQIGLHAPEIASHLGFVEEASLRARHCRLDCLRFVLGGSLLGGLRRR
mmetsp:Transcript_85968/g.246777  ORF Transcript_85968/g.246777 Transcript_85968/m.246777 type:complete len:206 (+) Transcript_85968:885-1502(+)